jgi:hypothetical protein
VPDRVVAPVVVPKVFDVVRLDLGHFHRHNYV